VAQQQVWKIKFCSLDRIFGGRAIQFTRGNNVSSRGTCRIGISR